MTSAVLNRELLNTSMRLAAFSFACLTLFSPLIFGYGPVMEANLTGSITAQSLEDPICIILIRAATVILVPGLFDNCLDYLFPDQINSYLLERTALLIGLMVTYAGQTLSFLLEYPISSFVIFFVMNVGLYVCIPFLTLYRINPIFSPISISTIFTIVYGFLICAVWGIAINAHNIISLGSILRIIASTLISLQILAFYYFQVFLNYRSSKEMFLNWISSMDSSLQTAFIISTSILFVNVIFTIIPGALNLQPGFNNITVPFSKAYYISTIIFLLLLTVLPLRLIRRERELFQSDLQNKKHFVRYISHELRTPISIIITGLDLIEGMIKDRAPLQEILSFITELKEPCNTGVEILNDILAYEKIDGGEMVLERVSIDPFPFLERTLAPFRISARKKNIDFSVNLPVVVGAYSVYIDDTKVAQVLRNFLSNAIKFTPIEGRVEVTARVEESWLVVDVKDSGVGLSPANRELLFTRVVQFHARAQQGGGGSGLGLLISKKIVDMHEGEISVQSEGEGRGCTFTMKLRINEGLCPLEENAINSQHIQPIQESEAPHESQSLPAVQEVDEFLEVSHLRILIVDDSALNRKVMRRRLESDGYTCVEADDGDTAVSFMERTQCAAVDVITMDNMMPRMRGTEATEKIRRFGYKGTIVGITGNALDDDVKDFIAHGANKVIPKPFDLMEFKKVLLAIREEQMHRHGDGPSSSD